MSMHGHLFQYFSKPEPKQFLAQIILPTTNHKYYQDAQSDRKPVKMSQNLVKETQR